MTSGVMADNEEPTTSTRKRKGKKQPTMSTVEHNDCERPCSSTTRRNEQPHTSTRRRKTTGKPSRSTRKCYIDLIILDSSESDGDGVRVKY